MEEALADQNKCRIDDRLTTMEKEIYEDGEMGETNMTSIFEIRNSSKHGSFPDQGWYGAGNRN